MTSRRPISARRLSIHCVALALLFCASATSLFAKEEKKGPDRGSVVKELYQAHQHGDPLFDQTKDRTLLDRFFTKELADKLWAGAKAAKGEPGSLVLLGTRDEEITNFKVGDTNYGKHDRSGEFIPYEGFAIVDVTFTAAGKPKYMSYQVETEGSDVGKISNIRYNEGPSLVDALKEKARGVR